MWYEYQISLKFWTCHLDEIKQTISWIAQIFFQDKATMMDDTLCIIGHVMSESTLQFCKRRIQPWATVFFGQKAPYRESWRTERPDSVQ